MSRRSFGLKSLFLIAGLCAPMASPGEEQDLLAPATPKPLIQRWAQRVPEPLWRIPIGPSYVDGMDRVDADHLFVGLRSIGQQVFNQAGLLVDIRSGRVVWRSQREKNGVYSYLFSDADLIFEQLDNAPEHRFIALDKATGAVRWQILRKAEAVRFVLAPGHGLVLVENRDKRKVEVEAFRLSDGARAWRREHRLPDDAAPPASAAVVGETICVFYEGLAALRPTDGTSLWRRADIVVLEDDPLPRQASGALIVVHGERLEALKPQTGKTVWSAALRMRASNIFPFSDRVYVRGVLPYRDPQERFALQVPTSWPLSWQKNDVAYRFDDMAGGAYLLITWVRPESGSRLDLRAIYEMMHDALENISDGKLTKLDKQDLSIAGLPARRARFQHVAKADGVELAAVTEVVAVYNEELQAGCGLLGFSPISRHDAVKEDLDRAIRSLRFTGVKPDGGAISTVDRWRQRSAGANAGTPSVASRWQGRSAEPAGVVRYRIAAFRAVDGYQLWHHDTTEATVSNLVAQRDRLYLATSQEMLALNAASGDRAFAVTVTDIGRAFPVRLRAYEDRVVFIGELVVAAYDPVTGAEVYRHGITPLSQETTLDGLDNSIPAFQEIARAVGEIQPQGNVAGLIAGMKATESVQYQQLATRFDARARSLKLSGMDYSSELAQRDMAKTISDIQAKAAMAQSLVSIGGALWEMFRIRGWVRYYRNFLTRQQLFRRSIIAAYASGETMDWVHRPHRRMNLSGDGDFATVTVVHLPTGKRRTTTLSPNYLNYGLWNYVDFERGLAVHHGLGLDTTHFEYAPKERVGAFGKVRTVGSFLLAVPVEIPESESLPGSRDPGS